MFCKDIFKKIFSIQNQNTALKYKTAYEEKKYVICFNSKTKIE